MCCCNSRKIPVTITTILSVVTLILGAIMLGLSFKFKNEEFFKTFDLDEVNMVHDKGFIMLIVAAGLVMFIGLYGLIFPCVKHRFFTVVFGVLAGLVLLLVFIEGVILTAVSYSTPEQLNSFCDGTNPSNVKFLADFQSKLANADTKINRVVGLTMCSDVCPCFWDPAWGANPWIALGDAELAKHGRVINSNNTVDANGYYRLQFNATSVATGIQNFTQCYDILKV